MQDFEKSFWKFASTIKGAVVLEDAFLDWIEKEGMAVDNAQTAWDKISSTVESVFNKKADNVTVEISGDSSTVQQMLKSMPDASVNTEIEPPLGEAPIAAVEEPTPEIPVEPKQETKTLVESLEEPEGPPEEIGELPPLPA